MFSGVFICTPMQPVFSKIKDPEEHNNNGVNHAALWRTNLPAAPCTPFTAAFWGLELLVCFQPSIIQSLQRCTLHKTLSFIWPLTVPHSSFSLFKAQELHGKEAGLINPHVSAALWLPKWIMGLFPPCSLNCSYCTHIHWQSVVWQVSHWSVERTVIAAFSSFKINFTALLVSQHLWVIISQPSYVGFRGCWVELLCFSHVCCKPLNLT